MTTYIRYLMAITALLSAIPASAASISFEFNTDGVLPSAQGASYATTGPAEAGIYSVSGGLLHQSSYSSPSPVDSVGYRAVVAYDPALPSTWEWRVRILDPIDPFVDCHSLHTMQTLVAGGRPAVAFKAAARRIQIRINF